MHFTPYSTTYVFPSVCTTTCGLLVEDGLLELYKQKLPSAALTLVSVWASPFFCPILKSVSDSPDWLQSLLFCCPFFRVETVTKPTGETKHSTQQLSTKWTKNNDGPNNTKNKTFLMDSEVTCCRSVFIFEWSLSLSLSLLSQMLFASSSLASVLFAN